MSRFHDADNRAFQRTLAFERLENRDLLASLTADVAGDGNSTGLLDETAQSVRFRVDVTDSAGAATRNVRASELFYLSVYVEDLRDDPGGVFAAYLDLAFDASNVTRSGEVVFGDRYQNVNVRGGSAPGLLDEVGAVSGSIRPLGEGEFLLFRAPFRASTAGPTSFFAEPADKTPNSLVLVYGGYSALSASQIDFGSVQFEVLPTLSVTTGASSLLGRESVGVSLRGDAPQPDVPLNGVEIVRSFPQLVQYYGLRPSHYEPKWGASFEDPDDLQAESTVPLHSDLIADTPSNSARLIDETLVHDSWIKLPLRSRRTGISKTQPLEESRRGSHEPERWRAVYEESVTLQAQPASRAPSEIRQIPWLSSGFQRISFRFDGRATPIRNPHLVDLDQSFVDLSRLDYVWSSLSWGASAFDSGLEPFLVGPHSAPQATASDEENRDAHDPLFNSGDNLRAARGARIAFDFGNEETMAKTERPVARLSARPLEAGSVSPETDFEADAKRTLREQSKDGSDRPAEDAG